jgi:hypothetical protein
MKKALAKVVLSVKKRFLTKAPYPSIPFPLKGAREVDTPQSFPAPFEGRMSEGQIGGLTPDF